MRAGSLKSHSTPGQAPGPHIHSTPPHPLSLQGEGASLPLFGHQQSLGLMYRPAVVPPSYVFIFIIGGAHDKSLHTADSSVGWDVPRNVLKFIRRKVE